MTYKILIFKYIKFNNSKPTVNDNNKGTKNDINGLSVHPYCNNYIEYTAEYTDTKFLELQEGPLKSKNMAVLWNASRIVYIFLNETKLLAIIDIMKVKGKREKMFLHRDLNKLLYLMNNSVYEIMNILLKTKEYLVLVKIRVQFLHSVNSFLKGMIDINSLNDSKTSIRELKFYIHKTKSIKCVLEMNCDIKETFYREELLLFNIKENLYNTTEEYFDYHRSILDYYASRIDVKERKLFLDNKISIENLLEISRSILVLAELYNHKKAFKSQRMGTNKDKYKGCDFETEIELKIFVLVNKPKRIMLFIF